eukprot:2787061-Rhodomonas_salina.1
MVVPGQYALCGTELGFGGTGIWWYRDSSGTELGTRAADRAETPASRDRTPPKGSVPKGR